MLFIFYFRFAIFDTPGQIEVFTWSASGAIITEALASSFATVVVYIIDTARSTSPVTFMSNMLYACSILYKTKLPFIVVLNKVIPIEGNPLCLRTPILLNIIIPLLCKMKLYNKKMAENSAGRVKQVVIHQPTKICPVQYLSIFGTLPRRQFYNFSVKSRFIEVVW